MRTIFSSVFGDSNESPSTARTVLCSSLICTSIFNPPFQSASIPIGLHSNRPPFQSATESRTSDTDVDGGANRRRPEADERNLVNPLVGDLDGFNSHVVLRGVQRGTGVFHRQPSPEIPDVVRRLLIGGTDGESDASHACS